MRASSAVSLALTFCLLAPARPLGADEPVAPPAPPTPVAPSPVDPTPVDPAPALAPDSASDLAAALLGPPGAARTAAEERVSSADAASLRGVVEALRRRVWALAPTPAVAQGVMQGPILRLDVRMVRASLAVAGALIRAGRLEATGTRTYAPGVLERWLERCSNARGVEVLTSPSLGTYSGQKATVSVLQQVSYVEDFEVENGLASVIANPVIQTISEGLILDVTSTLTNGSILVVADLRLAELIRPMAQFRTLLANTGAPVTIQLPELVHGGVQRSLRVQPGVPTLLANLPSRAAGGGDRVLVFLTAAVEAPAGTLLAPSNSQAPGK